MVLEHVDRLQILMIDGVVLLNQMKRRLVVKVGPLALHLQMRFREHLHRFTAAVTPLLAACYLPLCRFQAMFGFAVTAGIMDHRAIRERGKGF